MGLAACKNTDFTHIFPSHFSLHVLINIFSSWWWPPVRNSHLNGWHLKHLKHPQYSPSRWGRPRKLLLHKSIFHIMLYLKLYPPNPSPKVNLKLCACELSETPGTSPCLGFFSTLTLVALVVWNVFIPLAIESYGHVHILGGHESSN